MKEIQNGKHALLCLQLVYLQRQSPTLNDKYKRIYLKKQIDSSLHTRRRRTHMLDDSRL